jgi:trimethylamine--corrinoid protein Co-methyltransferase
MPLMGLTSPAGLLSTIVLGNCEVLATLCLAQAAERGAPFIYAPAFAVMEPRSGRFGGGGPEHALLGAAGTEIARSYGLAVEASAGGTDHHVPGIQAAYERALGWELPVLAWPDLLVGPGVFGAATLSLEQVILDVEVFRRCRRLVSGIGDGPDGAADRIVEMLASAGPGGEFLAERDTRAASRSGEWYVGRLGVHDGFERWDGSGRPDVLEEARERVAALIAGRQALPFDDDTERELAALESRARATGPAGGRGPTGGGGPAGGRG